MLGALGALHALGHPVDWSGLLGGASRFVRLPPYSWQRERAGTRRRSRGCRGSTPPTHPLLGVAQRGPRPAWEARLDLRLTPYLADHRVQQGVILPATAYLELAFAVGREAFGSAGCTLRDVKFANPCFLASDEPLWAHTAFDADQRRPSRSTRAPSRATVNGPGT